MVAPFIFLFHKPVRCKYVDKIYLEGGGNDTSRSVSLQHIHFPYQCQYSKCQSWTYPFSISMPVQQMALLKSVHPLTKIISQQVLASKYNSWYQLIDLKRVMQSTQTGCCSKKNFLQRRLMQCLLVCKQKILALYIFMVLLYYLLGFLYCFNLLLQLLFSSKKHITSGLLSNAKTFDVIESETGQIFQRDGDDFFYLMIVWTKSYGIIKWFMH